MAPINFLLTRRKTERNLDHRDYLNPHNPLSRRWQPLQVISELEYLKEDLRYEFRKVNRYKKDSFKDKDNSQSESLGKVLFSQLDNLIERETFSHSFCRNQESITIQHRSDAV